MKDLTPPIRDPAYPHAVRPYLGQRRRISIAFNLSI
jgi:hypothetical protein